MGRQPWIVFSLLQTSSAVSPNVTGIQVLLSLVAFTVVYGSLAVVEFRLILKAAQKGPEAEQEPDPVTGEVVREASVY